MFPFTLQQLRILKALATEQNFTKAAESVYLSQPSVSKQIKAFEKNFNLVLIQRNSHQISLTEDGRVMLDYAERILALSEECCRVFMDRQKGERGKVTIGTTQTVGSYLLPKVMDLFAKNYPHIQLELTIDSPNRIRHLVQQKQVAIGLVSREIGKELPHNEFVETLVEDEISFMVPNSYVFPSEPRLWKNSFYQLNFITLDFKADFQTLIHHRLRQNRVEPKHLKRIFQVKSLEAMKVAVKLGFGVAFVTSSSIENELRRKRIQRVTLPNFAMSQSVWIVRNSQSLQQPACEIFYRELCRLGTSFQD